MNCYNCGCSLSKHDFCTACKADVRLYKKIMYASNRLYNEGLEKAKVRDLSGAAESLRQSLKFNKNNVEARNLLGLVYFETGEVVAALSEWVISKNFSPEKNIAESYINTIQSNPGRLESLNSAVKKYNQAYVQCLQDGKDMAVIHLKKTININPKFIRARKMLALLFIDREDWDGAKREVDKCLAIDHNDTQCLYYKSFLDQILAPDDNEKPFTSKKKKETAKRYTTDNMDIIEPVGNGGGIRGAAATILNILIGVVIGIAALYVLVIPKVENEAAEKANVQVTEMGEQLDNKTLAIKGLEMDIRLKDNEINLLKEELDAYESEDNGILKKYDELMETSALYIKTQDIYSAAEDVKKLRDSSDPDSYSEAYRNLYNSIIESVSPKLASNYFEIAYSAYVAGDYDTAATNFELSFENDQTNVDALYYLAGSLRKLDRSEDAVAKYQLLIELFPDTQRAKKADEFIKQETS